MATITALVRKEEWGKAIALHEVGPNLTMIVAPVVVGLLAGLVPWRLILRGMALVSLGAGTAFALWGRGGRFGGTALRLSSLRSLMRIRPYWILLSLLCVVLASTSGVFSILPTFLVTERGMTLKMASTLLGISRPTVLITVFASGWVVDRLGPYRSILLFLVGTALLTLGLATAVGPLLVICVCLQPVFGAAFFPAALAALSALAPDDSRNVLYSATFPFVVLIGAGIAPAGLGWMGDVMTFSTGILILGVLGLAALPLVRLTRGVRPGKRRD
jgi:NNP family nitrate/nitrite transporter-like MFS transporter